MAPAALGGSETVLLHHDAAARVVTRALRRTSARRRLTAQMARMNAHRRFVLREIVDTEDRYFAALLGLQLGVLLPLWAVDSPLCSEIVGRCLYHTTVLVRIHANFGHQLRNAVQAELEQLRDLSPVPSGVHHQGPVGDCFQRLSLVAQSVYANYLCDYTPTQQHLAVVRNTEFLDELLCLLELGVGCRHVDDLLVAPVQRMPRYLLLLQNLQRATLSTHPTRNSLAQVTPIATTSIPSCL